MGGRSVVQVTCIHQGMPVCGGVWAFRGWGQCGRIWRAVAVGCRVGQPVRARAHASRRRARRRPWCSACPCSTACSSPPSMGSTMRSRSSMGSTVSWGASSSSLLGCPASSGCFWLSCSSSSSWPSKRASRASSSAPKSSSLREREGPSAGRSSVAPVGGRQTKQASMLPSLQGRWGCGGHSAAVKRRVAKLLGSRSRREGATSHQRYNRC